MGKKQIGGDANKPELMLASTKDFMLFSGSSSQQLSGASVIYCPSQWDNGSLGSAGLLPSSKHTT